MPPVYSTLSAASSMRMRNAPVKKSGSAPLSAEEIKRKATARAEKQEKIDAAVDEWREYTNRIAHDLAEQFDMKPRYFFDIFFQGGAHMVNHQEKINPYNAFKSEKAAEARERTS
jgi:hypothetical protein